MSNKQIYELAILGRATWELHSLNNEGTVGNVTEPRTVVLANGKKTDAVSGEMLKHIHAMKMWELESDKSKFCKPCRELEPSKAAHNPDMKKITGKDQERKKVEKAVEDCLLCDLHGFLIPGGRGGRPVARPSTIEFGWAVGLLPEEGVFHRGFHVHARHAVGGKKKGTTGSADTTTEASEPLEEDATSQMIYHRPTRSGQYAVISVFRPWRIGLNNVDMTYVSGVDRDGRYKLALAAYRALFINPEGAMTTTRLPHSGPFEGIIVYTTDNHPVPILSPLHDNYKEDIQTLAEKINTATNSDDDSKEKQKNKLNGNTPNEPVKLVTVEPFKSLDNFISILGNLGKKSPYTIKLD